MGENRGNNAKKGNKHNGVKPTSQPCTGNGGRRYADSFAELQTSNNQNNNEDQKSISTKRRRHSTGVSSSQSNAQSSKEAFKILSTDDKLVQIFDLVSNLTCIEQHVSKEEQNVNIVDQALKSTDSRVLAVAYKSIDNEARDRRDNLVFRGFPEVRQENCKETILNFIHDKLGINDSIHIQRAHRFGEQHFNKPRPIMVRFRDFGDIKNILSNAHKLRGQNYGINRDYPPEIVTARSRLWPLHKAARESNPRGTVKIGYPAKLIVKSNVIQDEFPAWKHYMRLSRIDTRSTTPQPATRSEIPLQNRFDILVNTASTGNGAGNIARRQPTRSAESSSQIWRDVHNDDHGAGA